jgi:hypothetical protein
MFIVMKFLQEAKPKAFRAAYDLFFALILDSFLVLSIERFSFFYRYHLCPVQLCVTL